MASNQDKHDQLSKIRLRYGVIWLAVYVPVYLMIFYLVNIDFISTQTFSTITLVMIFSTPAYIIILNTYLKRKLRLTWKEALLS